MLMSALGLLHIMCILGLAKILCGGAIYSDFDTHESLPNLSYNHTFNKGLWVLICSESL